MNRRDSLKFLTMTGVIGMSTPVAGAIGGISVAVYDGRFAEARAFARAATHAFDCRVDAASLWYRAFADRAERRLTIHGLTSAADALVFADCARREGLQIRMAQPSGSGAMLVAWTIAPRGFWCFTAAAD